MESNLSPVVLFVFNRPQHTADTLNSLKDSFLAESTDLFVFCDKPRHSDSNDCKKNNNEVINLFKNLSGFRSVTINVRETNYGLSKNIIHGIDEILNKYDKVIVLEDDMIVSKATRLWKQQCYSIQLYYQMCHRTSQKIIHVKLVLNMIFMKQEVL